MSWKRWLFCNQKAFLLQVVLHELKKQPFQSNKNILFCRNFSNCTWKSSAFTKQKVFYFQKALRIALKNHLFVHKKLFFCTNLSSLFSKISHFHKPKAFFLYQPFHIALQSTPFPPSISHSHPAITYCLQRIRLFFVVRSKSLRCNTGTSHRFKAFSPPFCAKNRFRLVPPENSAEIYFDRALNRRSQDGVPCAFWLLFAQRKKWQAVPFAGSFEVFQTSIQLAAIAASLRQT